jgi:formylglycine-generating enzyme required for sulfatase activity
VRPGGAVRCYQDPVLDQTGWYCHNSDKSSHPVGLKPPNPAGFFDILGNGAEWMHNEDQYSYGKEPLVDPFGTMNAANNVREIRGGGWSFYSYRLRAAAHFNSPWTAEGVSVRLARTLAPGETW